MARTGGRSLWLAIPGGILCVVIVAVLVWVAVPMVPTVLAWAGDSLRATSERREAEEAAPAPAERLAAGEDLDCRDVYPDDLWGDIMWHGDVLLNQSRAQPALAASDLAAALAPTTLRTCVWRISDQPGITSTIASVGVDAVAVAEASLAGQGFACTRDDVSLSCSRTADGATEEHVFRDGLWLASTVTGWSPDAYGSRLAAYVFG